MWLGFSQLKIKQKFGEGDVRSGPEGMQRRATEEAKQQAEMRRPVTLAWLPEAVQ